MKNWAEQAKAAGGPTGAVVHPAATVVLLRDGGAGVEVLMMKRSSKLAFHGGAWVFPGGRIDDEDWGGGGDIVAAARRAAAREAAEEADLVVDPEALVHFANWTTPEVSPKRFATWFFAGPAGDGDVHADGVESDEHRWFRPDDALAARDAGEIELAPPQFVTLLELRAVGSVGEALTCWASGECLHYTPRFHFLDEGASTCVYAEDVSYDDIARWEHPGPRHRLVMFEDRWIYERDF